MPDAVPDAGAREAAVLDRIAAFRRRRPRLTDEVVTLAHGAGGKASAALVDAVFLDAFLGVEHGALGDAAVVELPGGERLAFSTDTFVVSPRRFPGGSIGHLAVHGTVNDVAVQGGRPMSLTAAFVIEEGFPVAELHAVVADMAEAAAAAGVRVVAGDTKVVGTGAADGLYISTAGIGLIPAGRVLGPDLVRPGDRVLVSGTIADHGMAVMLARGDLALEADIRSDTAPVNDLVEALLAAAPSTRWLRDPTRGGLGTVCNELARDANWRSSSTSRASPSPLPWSVRVISWASIRCTSPTRARWSLSWRPTRSTPRWQRCALIPSGGRPRWWARSRPSPEGIVVLRTSFGGTRIVDMLVGDPLPRIC